MNYTLLAIINNEEITSQIFDSKEEALDAQKDMLDNWGIESELEDYESEPSDDGYDFDKYQ